MDGADICTEIVKRAAAGYVYSEAVACYYMRQLFDAVCYLHNNDIVHRDIKPQCILITNASAADSDATPTGSTGASGRSPNLKLGGFGTAIQLNSGLHSGGPVTAQLVGTPLFMAPEVVKHALQTLFSAADPFSGAQAQAHAAGVSSSTSTLTGVGVGSSQSQSQSQSSLISVSVYGKAVDMWSCGVLLFLLLSGRLPFQGGSTTRGGKQFLFKQIYFGYYHMSDRVWQYITDDAKDLLRRLLEIDPDRRIRIEEVLQHPWLRKGKHNKLHLYESVDHLKVHLTYNKLKANVLKCVNNPLWQTAVATMAQQRADPVHAANASLHVHVPLVVQTHSHSQSRSRAGIVSPPAALTSPGGESGISDPVASASGPSLRKQTARPMAAAGNSDDTAVVLEHDADEEWSSQSSNVVDNPSTAYSLGTHSNAEVDLPPDGFAAPLDNDAENGSLSESPLPPPPPLPPPLPPQIEQQQQQQQQQLEAAVSSVVNELHAALDACQFLLQNAVPLTQMHTEAWYFVTNEPHSPLNDRRLHRLLALFHLVTSRTPAFLARPPAADHLIRYCDTLSHLRRAEPLVASTPGGAAVTELLAILEQNSFLRYALVACDLIARLVLVDDSLRVSPVPVLSEHTATTRTARRRTHGSSCAVATSTMADANDSEPNTSHSHSHSMPRSGGPPCTCVNETHSDTNANSKGHLSADDDDDDEPDALHPDSRDNNNDLTSSSRPVAWPALVQTSSSAAARVGTPNWNRNVAASRKEVQRVRMVQFERTSREPLGITLKLLEDGRCVVARIIYGGLMHRQGILHVGDEIREINRVAVTNRTIEQLQAMLRDATGTISMKIVPCVRTGPQLLPDTPPALAQFGAGLLSPPGATPLSASLASLSLGTPLTGAGRGGPLLESNMYLRALFAYEPAEDRFCPCRAAGLRFQIGSILQVLSKDDHNWWQAVLVDQTYNSARSPLTASTTAAVTSTHNGSVPRLNGSSAGGSTGTSASTSASVAPSNEVFTQLGIAGLIPSPELQEWKVAHDSAARQRKRNAASPATNRRDTERQQEREDEGFSTSCASFLKQAAGGKKRGAQTQVPLSTADPFEILTYEEVVSVSRFAYRSLVLLGAHGVGRRQIKNALIRRSKGRFAYPIPHTSREPQAGEAHGTHYFFTELETMLREIANNEYLEYGTHENAMYGTKLDTIRRLISSGHVSILDVEPHALKVLRSHEFAPFVVFVAPPIDISLFVTNAAASAQHQQQQQQQPHATGRANHSSGTGTGSSSSADAGTGLGASSSVCTSVTQLNDAAINNLLLSSELDASLRRLLYESYLLEISFQHYFDLKVVNFDLDQTVAEIEARFVEANNKPRWIPVNWIY